MSPENANNLLKALAQFGFSCLGLKAQDFLTPNQIIQLEYPPNRIDLLTNIDGVDFADCYPDKLEVTVDGIVVNFIDLINLRKNKEASGRFQDLADLENLSE